MTSQFLAGFTFCASLVSAGWWVACCVIDGIQEYERITAKWTKP